MSAVALRLERRDQPDETPTFGPVSLTPFVHEDYWEYRVCVSEGQAVVGFPKFSTIGIGFAVEEDWNTNLPFTCKAEEIAEHIEHNAGSESITHETIVAAIRLIQDAAAADHPDIVERWNSYVGADRQFVAAGRLS